MVNNYRRESLAIKVADRIRGEGVVKVLQRLMRPHRLLRTIRADKGLDLAGIQNPLGTLIVPC